MVVLIESPVVLEPCPFCGSCAVSFAQRSELALKLKQVIRERAKEKQITSTGGESPQLLPNSAKAVKTDTRKELAKIAGVFPDSIWKTEKILSKGTPEQIDRARKGGKGNSVNVVYKENDSILDDDVAQEIRLIEIMDEENCDRDTAELLLEDEHCD